MSAAWLIPADVDNPGVHQVDQADGDTVVIASPDEAWTIVVADVEP